MPDGHELEYWHWGTRLDLNEPSMSAGDTCMGIRDTGMGRGFSPDLNGSRCEHQGLGLDFNGHGPKH